MFTGMTGDRSPRRRRRGAAAAAAAATAVLVVTLDGVDGFSPVVPATNDTPHRRRLLQHHPAATTATRLDQAPGSSGDYLSRLSNDGDDLELGSLNDDELVSGGKTNSSPSRPSLQSAITAASDLPRQAKEGASGLTSSFVANVGNLGERASGGVNELTRGTSEYLQNLAGSSLRGVNRISRKGGIDIKRARLRAERVAKKSTDSLAMAGGLSDLNFFGVGSIDTPKVDAEEIVKWMESQTKSGTEMVGQGTEAVGLMAKRLVLKFTGKDTYQFGDVTKALVHRISSQEINVTDTILLLKVSYCGNVADLAVIRVQLTFRSIDLARAWHDNRPLCGAPPVHIFGGGAECIARAEGGGQSPRGPHENARQSPCRRAVYG